MTDRLTLPELEQYLAKAADLLRGSIDQADFKAYIFPLMFFKRISDVYLEEFAAGAGGVRRRPRVRGLRREPPLRDPRGQPVGRRAQPHREHRHAPADGVPRDREGQPETLYGIFGNANWTNKDKLPDRKLADLIEHFSTQDALQRQRRPGRVRQRVRVPHQAVRRPVEQEGRRVLHPALSRRPADQHPRPAGGRERLRPGLRHRRHADRGHRAREGRRRQPQDAVGQALRPGEGPHHLRRSPA